MIDPAIDELNETIPYTVRVDRDGPLRVATAQVMLPAQAFVSVYTLDDTSAARALEEALKNLGFTGDLEKREDL